MINVSYGRSREAWDGYTTILKKVIEENSFKRICEVGGGANPTLPIDYISSNNLDYVILDISEKELEKAPVGYNKVVKDICSKELDYSAEFDLIFSQMVAEHVKKPKIFHANIYKLLSDGGIAFHFFPTLYALPFVINRVVPERIASYLLHLFFERDRFQHNKFPVYYRWCRGPTKRQIKRFKRLHYDILEYRGFFGHKSYYNKLHFIMKISKRISEYLISHPSPYFTSFAHVFLKK